MCGIKLFFKNKQTARKKTLQFGQLFYRDHSSGNVKSGGSFHWFLDTKEQTLNDK